jgi:hypothetical protein
MWQLYGFLFIIYNNDFYEILWYVIHMLLVNIHCKYITNNERIICVQGNKYSIPVYQWQKQKRTAFSEIIKPKW